MKIFNTIRSILDFEFFNIMLSAVLVICCTLFKKNQIINFYFDTNYQPTILIDTDNFFLDLTFRNNQQVNLFISLLKHFDLKIERVSIEQSIFNYISHKYGNNLSDITIRNVVRQYLLGNFSFSNRVNNYWFFVFRQIILWEKWNCFLYYLCIWWKESW